jgi:hypothetical protein
MQPIGNPMSEQAVFTLGEAAKAVHRRLKRPDLIALDRVLLPPQGESFRASPRAGKSKSGANRIAFSGTGAASDSPAACLSFKGEFVNIQSEEPA